MKIKRFLLVLLPLILSLFAPMSVFAAVTVRFLDDGDLREPLKAPITAAGSPSVTGVFVFVEKTTIASLCASSSPNVTTSRRNAIAGMVGMVVNTDPSDPAGWYLVPSGSVPDGWQWHDITTSTTFPLWRGDTSQTDERGNRLVAHFMGRSPVGAYKGRVVTSLTNISETVFAIGKNSSGADRKFNVNLVGIDLGENGVRNSTYNPATGVWTQSGDDTVFSNGESPEDVHYDVWYDFGATIVVTANSPSSLDGVKNQFILGSPTLTVELIRDETVVHPQTIVAEQPQLVIYRGTNSVDGELQNVRIYLDYGQFDVDYRVEWKGILDDQPWSELEFDLRKLGDGIETDLPPLSNRFFRVRSRLGEIIVPASSQARTISPFRRANRR